MEASAAPRLAPAGAFMSPQLLRLASDARLIALIREGRSAAFEVLYDRHHRGILSFCRHMLSDPQEAEDAVQHTFLAAYNDLISSHKQIHLRAWLFAIARNRCYSILRSRRDQLAAELGEPATEGLATQVQRRQDLRDLVLDMRRLPDEQRAALVLAELDSLSHEQIGEALGVPREKVKALVFQARESLVASRAARETDCSEIREQLATQRGGALRRSNLRRHLRECAGCRDFRKEIERQRRQLAVLLPVAPTIALKEGVLAGTIGGGAAAGVAGGGLVASTALKTGLVKVIAGALLAGAGTAGTIVATHNLGLQGARERSRPAQESVAGASSVSSVRTGLVAGLSSTSARGSAAAAGGARRPAVGLTPTTGGAGLLGTLSHGAPAARRLAGLYVGPSVPASSQPASGGATASPAQPAGSTTTRVPSGAPPVGSGGHNGHEAQHGVGSGTGVGATGSGSPHHHGGHDSGSGGSAGHGDGSSGGGTRGEGGGAYTGGSSGGASVGSRGPTGNPSAGGSDGSSGAGTGDPSGAGTGDPTGAGSGSSAGSSGSGTDPGAGSSAGGGSGSGTGSGDPGGPASGGAPGGGSGSSAAGPTGSGSGPGSSPAVGASLTAPPGAASALPAGAPDPTLVAGSTGLGTPPSAGVAAAG